MPILQEIKERCTECGACRKYCAFLSRYGTPKRIADHLHFSLSHHPSIAYECSLCGLCSAICPEDLDPASLFLGIRRRFVEDGHFDETPYRAILGYEKRGVSPLFSWYGLPEGCDTVFFPGCTLPGTRPAVTMKLYRQLKETIPALGFVLDCCTKPSHNLGRTGPFHAAFGEMHLYLIKHGIRTVLTACPNCTRIFRQYGSGLTVRTVYEILHDIAYAIPAHSTGTALTIHDPCALRADLNTHSAIRGLLAQRGYTVTEMKHSGKKHCDAAKAAW